MTMVFFFFPSSNIHLHLTWNETRALEIHEWSILKVWRHCYAYTLFVCRSPCPCVSVYDVQQIGFFQEIWLFVIFWSLIQREWSSFSYSDIVLYWKPGGFKWFYIRYRNKSPLILNVFLIVYSSRFDCLFICT